jgi:gliding motility-associated-like protein
MMKKFYYILIPVFTFLFSETAHAQCTGTPITGFYLESKKNVSCFGGADGEITVRLNGGEAPFTYSLILETSSGSIPAGTFEGVYLNEVTFTGLYSTSIIPGAKYKASVITSNGGAFICNSRVITDIVLNQPTDISIAVNNITPDCDNSGSGAIDITVSGGTSPYSFAWTGPSTIGNIEDPNNILAGSYSVTVTDANSCTKNLNNFIVQQGTVGGSLSEAGPVCSGSNSGTITLTGHIGSVLRWESSTDNFNTVINDQGNGGSNSFNFSNLVATTAFRAVVQVSGCQIEYSTTTEVVVNPMPDATITAAGPFCASDGAVGLTAATLGGTWSGTGITDATAGTFDPSVAGAGLHLITYEVTVGGCTSIDTKEIEVLPMPDATITAAGPFCASDVAVGLTAATPGGTWSGPGITDATAGTFDPSVAGAGLHLINYEITVGGCTSIGTEEIEVLPMPDATITAAGPFCVSDGAVGLTAATPDGTWSGPGITNATAGIFDPSVAGAGLHLINYEITVGGCTSIGTEEIEVLPMPDATITAAGPFCASDGAVGLTAATPGGTWSGPGITDATAGTFDPSVAGAGLHLITYEVTIGGCTSIDTEEMEVLPMPDATITAAGPFCASDGAVNLTAATPGGTWSGTGITDATSGTFDPSVAGAGLHLITYEVTVGGCTSIDTEEIEVLSMPDATITAAGPFCASDGAVGLTAATPGGTWSGPGITDATAGTFDPSVAGAGLHLITYEVTVGGCTSIDTEEIDVLPIPDATITAAGPFCASDGAVGLTAAIPGGTWSGTGITDATAGTFDPAVAGVGLHLITYEVTVGGCTSIDTEEIEVLPIPDATITAAGPFCASDGAVGLTAATPGGTWSGTGITDATVGIFDPSVAGAGIHFITYEVTIGGCTSIDTEEIEVLSIPDATITAAGPFCASDGAVVLTAATPGGTWSGMGIIDATAGTFDPSVAGAGLHLITYEVTVGGCTSIDTEEIEVLPMPDATITVAGPFCASDGAVGLTAATPGGTWSGSGITDATAGTFDPTVAGAGLHLITYEVTVGGCTSIDTEEIEILSIPDATITASGSFCASDGAVFLMAATPGGTWSGTGITDATAGTFDPSVAGAGLHLITYEVTVGGCTSIDTEEIEILSIPDATITGAGPLCASDGAVVLTAATLGGTWSGPGITDATAGTFDPAIAGVGFHLITYEVTVGGCTSIDTEEVEVLPMPDATITLMGPFCASDGAVDLTAATPGGTWSGPGITDATTGTFDPSVAGAGLHLITYEVTVGGCTSIDTEEIEILPIPDATITAAGPLCASDGAVDLTAATSGGTWSGPGITNATAGTFDPAVAGVGLHLITYELTIGSCISSDIKEIEVLPVPNATIAAAGPFCAADGEVNLTATTPGGSWSGPGITDAVAGTFDPTVAGAGIHAITYEVVVNGCISSDTQYIIVEAVPPPPSGANHAQYCEGETKPSISVDPPLPGYIIFWFDAPTGGTLLSTGHIFTPLAASGDFYAAAYGENTGCISPSRIMVTLTLNNSPVTSAITGPATPDCQTQVTYSVENTPGSVYDWTLPSGSLIVSGENSNSIVVSLGSFNGSIQVVEQNTAGCYGNPVYLPIAMSCDLTAGFTAEPAIICSGETITFDPSMSSGVTANTTYSWDFGPYATPETSTEPGVQQVVFNNTTTAPISVMVRLTLDDATLALSSFYELTVTINPTPAKPEIIPVDPVCATQNLVVMEADLPGGTWSGSGIVDPINGVFDPGSANIGLNQITYTITNGEGCSNSDTYYVVVNDVKTVHFHIGEYQGEIDNEVVVPVTTTGFNDLITAQFSLTWDPEIIQYAGVAQLDQLNLQDANFGELDASSGILTFSWDTDDDKTSLPDNSVIFALRFIVVGEACDKSDIVFADHPTIIEVYDDNICPATVELANGTVEVLGSGEEPVITPNPVAICIDEAVPTLTISGSGTFTWYDTDQTTILTTGTSLIPPIDNTLAGEYTFYASSQEGLCPESDKVPVTITVMGSLDASVNIEANQSNPVCAGEEITLVAVPDNGGSTPSYQWFVDGNAEGTGATLIRTFDVDAVVRVEMTSSLECAVPKPAEQTYAVEVISSINPSVSIISDPEPANICAGENINFSIQNIYGEGSAAQYQWQINQTDVSGATEPNFSANNLENGDVVRLLLTSSSLCATASDVLSNEIQIAVQEQVVASVTIDVSHNPVCDGEMVEFIATPVNGGTGPVYEWYVNGIPVGDNSPNLNISTLNDQDEVWVAMISNDPSSCLQGSQAESNRITISNPGALTASVIIEGPSEICYGSTAAYSVTNSIGGSSPTFEWFINGINVFTGTDYVLPANSSPANYTIAVRMTKGGAGSSCIQPEMVMSNTINLELKPESHPDCDIEDLWIQNPRVDMVSCPTVSDGRIRFVIVDGSGTFRYRLDNGPWINLNRWNATINNVSYGNHWLYAEDLVTGAVDSIEVFVGSSFGLAQEPLVTQPSCSGDDGSIALKLSGGSGSYNAYLHNQENDLIFESLDTGVDVLIEGLNAGTYFVTIEDALGTCTVEGISVNLSAPANCESPCQYEVTFVAFAETCLAGLDPNGRIEFTVTPAIGQYQPGDFEFVLISENGQESRQLGRIFDNLKAGDYDYWVINRFNSECDYVTGKATVPLRKSTLAVTAELMGNVTCYGSHTGRARLIVTAGGAAPYYYSLDKGESWKAFNSGDIISDLLPNDDGPYNILVADSPDDLCPAEVEVDIRNEHSEIQINVTATEASCNGNDGSFTINSITGGLAPYFIVFNGQDYNYSSGVPLVFSNLQKGTRHFIVKDAAGCEKSYEVFIGSPGLVYLEPLIVQDPTCEGNGEDGRVSFRIDLERSPLAGQYYYGIAFKDVPQDEVIMKPFSAMQTETVSNLTNGEYYLLVSVSGEGCTNKYDFAITSGPKKVDFDVIQAVDKICAARSGFLELGNFRGEMDSTFYISIHNINNHQLVHTAMYKYPQITFKMDTLNDRLNPGDYYIQVSQLQGTCQMKSGYKYISIKNIDPFVVTVKDVKPSWEDVDEGRVLIRVDSPKNNSYSASIDYENWKGLKFLVGPEGGYEIWFNNLAYGDYEVWVIDDNLGDKCLIKVNVEIERNQQLWIPNIFTPNNDGYNETFYIRNLTDNTKLIIKNRWGSIVYQSNNYMNDWDGGDLSDGIYYYQLITGGQNASGWVEIFRGAGPRLK